MTLDRFLHDIFTILAWWILAIGGFFVGSGTIYLGRLAGDDLVGWALALLWFGASAWATLLGWAVSLFFARVAARLEIAHTL